MKLRKSRDHAAADAVVDDNPTLADAGSGLLGKFRWFRWTRPFYGGIMVVFAGLVIGWLPLGPVTTIIHAGIGGWAGYACALILIAMGLFILFVPSQRMVASVDAVIVGLASFPLSNLGGFVVGMMSAVLGGSWAFGWVPNKPLSARQKRRIAKKNGGSAPYVPPDFSTIDSDPNLDRGSFTERV